MGFILVKACQHSPSLQFRVQCSHSLVHLASLNLATSFSWKSHREMAFLNMNSFIVVVGI